MTTLTISDALNLFTPKGKTTWNGHDYWYGPCVLCGGKDRFGVYEIEDSKGVLRPRWFCRNCNTNHPKRNNPKFWWLSNLIYLKTGKWPEETFVPSDSDYKSNAVVRATKPVQPPLFEDLSNKCPQDITLADVSLYASNSVPTQKYFGSYRLSAQTVQKFQLGYGGNIPHCILPKGWTIPTISLGANGTKMLRALQVRRDEQACLEVLRKRHPDWIAGKKAALIDKWLKEIEEGKRELLDIPTEQDLVEFCWPKYSSISGSQPGIWGDDLVTLPGGERTGPLLPYIFVTEDAKSAMVLRQDGYPAVAYKRRRDWDEHLSKVFSRVPTVYVIADRDERDNNMGHGMNIAVTTRDNILRGGPKNVKILLPPAPFNDVADLVRAQSYDSLRNFIDGKIPGIQPVLERDEANGE